LANVHEVNLLLKRSKEKIVEAVNKTKHRRRRRRRRRRIIVIVIALILFLCVFVLFELLV
jgi:cell division protein FtsB